MKTASIRDLHIRTSELVREAADGASAVRKLIRRASFGFANDRFVLR